MNKKNLTISNTLTESWHITLKNYSVLISVIAILFAISLVFAVFENVITNLEHNISTVSIIGVLVFAKIVESLLRFGIQNLTSIGYTQIQLNILDKKPANIAMLFMPEGLFWRYLATSIVYALITVGGLILLIVPGVIWAIKYQFALPLVVDKKLTLAQAIKKSGEITKGYKVWLFGLSLVLVGVNLLGLLALGVGLLFTVPLSGIAHIWVYRQLVGKK